MQDTHSFVVRVWLERGETPGAEPLFRGWVQHVQTGEKKGLARLDDLTPWIRARLAGSAGGEDR